MICQNLEDGETSAEGNEVTLDAAPANNFCDVMDVPPSSSRQPPDGDEFPDYNEATSTKTEPRKEPKPNWSRKLWATGTSHNLFKDQQSSFSVRDKIAIFSSTVNIATSTSLKKSNKSTDDIPTAIEKEYFEKSRNLNNSFPKVKRSLSTSSKTDRWISDKAPKLNGLKHSSLVEGKARSSLDITMETSHTRCLSEEKYDYADKSYAPASHLHTRSQSLLDISSSDQLPKKDRWKLLLEQRQRSLSKLKGLVIPEKVIEVDVPVLDLPEIKNNNLPSIVGDTRTAVLPPESTNSSCHRNSYVPFMSTPPWTNNLSANVPKYSPAFKRKSLQIHSETFTNGISSFVAPFDSTDNYSKLHPGKIDFCNAKVINDAPKSLESITSPTRSDSSFEYVTSSSDIKPHTKFFHTSTISQERTESKKQDDDSDNDSAVSSSQSSYISRTSPPASPIIIHTTFTSPRISAQEFLLHKDEDSDPQASLEGDNHNHRLLKAQSVEAINRKNILASAKCRSGRDLKIGSPLIQRRFEEEEKKTVITRDVLPEGNIHNITREENINNNTVATTPNSIKAEKENGTNTKKLTLNSLSNKSDKKDLQIKMRPNFSTLPRTKAASVNDLRKSFEKLSPSPTIETTNNHFIKNKFENSFKKEISSRRDTPVENKQESTVATNETIILRPEIPGGSVGVTLAGGADYETKEITVHKIRGDSSAHRDGRLQKGDFVLSINGKSVEGLTHRQLVALLKEPLPEITLVVSRGKTVSSTPVPTSPCSPEPKLAPLQTTKAVDGTSDKQTTITVSVIKDAAGIGISLEGGKDSPLGNMPLLIKKVFKGGAVEKTGKIQAGDQIVSVNDTDVSTMSRFEAWSVLKKLPENITISLTIRRLSMP